MLLDATRAGEDEHGGYHHRARRRAGRARSPRARATDGAAATRTKPRADGKRLTPAHVVAAQREDRAEPIHFMEQGHGASDGRHRLQPYAELGDEPGAHREGQQKPRDGVAHRRGDQDRLPLRAQRRERHGGVDDEHRNGRGGHDERPPVTNPDRHHDRRDRAEHRESPGQRETIDELLDDVLADDIQLQR